MEEYVFKKMEIRGIGFFSAFKLFFGLYMILSLIVFLTIQLFGEEINALIANFYMSIANSVNQLIVKYPILTTSPIVRSLALSILYGFIMALIIAICAGIYTIFALLLGGVTIRVRERVPIKTPFK